MPHEQSQLADAQRSDPAGREPPLMELVIVHSGRFRYGHVAGAYYSREGFSDDLGLGHASGGRIKDLRPAPHFGHLISVISHYFLDGFRPLHLLTGKKQAHSAINEHQIRGIELFYLFRGDPGFFFSVHHVFPFVCSFWVVNPKIKEVYIVYVSLGKHIIVPRGLFCQHFLLTKGTRFVKMRIVRREKP